ncbi:hypothetical protein BJY01DRAFT_234387 [Aspergillus pseudoustus]|uniref:Uncharacterized protein n=1 Tax=Aspergillus pseudoustus TaxID=1810923 RepID=A0ABR4K3L8_9EURO
MVDMSATHQILRSASSADGAYFHIDFGSRRAINPSIIPHPEDNTTWIVTAQLHESQEERGKDRPRLWFAELVCTAAFVPIDSSSSRKQTLRCVNPPLILPIAATPSDSSKCTGDQAFFTLSIGPHDARVFYGPDAPYTVYGSTSQLTCFGQWMLDFRLLVDWGLDTVLHHQGSFRQPTELQRPLLTPYRSVEKNWFVFWDAAAATGYEQGQGHSYVHYDIAPARSFAQLLEPADGSVGPDLAPQAAQNDDACLRRLLPALPDNISLSGSGDAESIHQATNALSITLCARADPFCVPGDDNTFVLSIFQHKSFYNLHSTYEPYAMLFRARAPFEVYGVSRRPLWIHGRRTPPPRQSSQWQPGSSSPMYDDHVNDDGDEEEMMRAVKLESEMLYVTSISWKAHGQGYHGFVDDVLFIGFGIEDSATGGIDVRAGDLVDGLALCV